MRKVIVWAAIAALLLPFSGQPAQATEIPPIAQPLVREGDLAKSLAGALQIGTAQDEAEAERMLAARGILPQKGWMADYPVTPEIIGQLRATIVEAADSQELSMKSDAAISAFEGLLVDLGLTVSTEMTEDYAAENPPEGYPDYLDAGVVDDYYYRSGPPVITYYLPPSAYYPLYTWVYYPFRCAGFFFSGYFILHNFDWVITYGHRHVVVSNYGFLHKGRDGRRFYYGKRSFTHARNFKHRQAAKTPPRHTAKRTRGKLSGGNGNVATPFALQQGGTAMPEVRQHRNFRRSEGKALLRQPERDKRPGRVWHRDFSATERRALTRPIAPRQNGARHTGAMRPRGFSAFGRGYAHGR